MVETLLEQHRGGVERKVPLQHSPDSAMPRLFVRHFLEKIPQLKGSQDQQSDM
jgi:hypothetical protein